MNDAKKNRPCVFVLTLVTLGLSGLSIPSPATARDYYVSPEGHDSGPGTVSLPWKTLAKANRTLRPGDVLFIREGVFDEIIEPFRSGLPKAPIVYRSFPGEEVVLRGQRNAEAIVSIGWEITGGGWEGKSYIVVDGLRLSERYHKGKAADEYPTHVLIYGVDSRHNEIRNCVMLRSDPIAKAREYGETDYGISISKSSNNTIEGNHIQGMTRVGIIVGGRGLGNVVRDNVVVDCISSSIVIASSKGTPQGTLIEGNMLGGSFTEDGIQFEPDYDLEFDDGTAQGVIIRGNVVFDNAENAIDLKGASNVVIEGNVIFGNRGDNEGDYEDEPDRNGGFGGITHGNDAGSKDVIIRRNVLYNNLSGIWVEQGYRIYNNVIIYNNRDYLGSNRDDGSVSNSLTTGNGSSAKEANVLRKPLFTGIWLYNDCANAAILNNIVGGHDSAEISLGPRAGDRFRINGNLYFNSVDTRFAFYRAPYDWNTGTFSSWKSHLLSLPSVTGTDMSSSVVEPLFLKVPEVPGDCQSDCDFCPGPGSPAVDSGDFLTRTSAAGSGVRITCEEVGFFCDGFGVVAGDMIQIEGIGEEYQITHIDHAGNTIVVDRPLEWSQNLGVALPYSGTAPDVGVCEYR